MRDSRISIVKSPESADISRSLTTFAMAVSELCKGRKPDWKFSNKLFFKR